MSSPSWSAATASKTVAAASGASTPIPTVRTAWRALVLRFGDLVKIETQRFAHGYMLLDDVAGER